jgi:hypothetical protein
VLVALVAFCLLMLASVGLLAYRPPQRSSSPWSAGDKRSVQWLTTNQSDKCG